MEELKRLHAKEQRRREELFALNVESEVLRIKQAKETISRDACIEQAKQFYIHNGYFSPYLSNCSTLIAATDEYLVHAAIVKRFKNDKNVNLSMICKRETRGDEDAPFWYSKDKDCPSNKCYKVSLVPEELFGNKA
jgi:hypothetical protein